MDAVLPPAGPALSCRSIPTPSLLGKVAPEAQQGEIGSVLNRNACPRHLSLVLALSSLEKEEGSSLGHLYHLCYIRTALWPGHSWVHWEERHRFL